MSIHNSLDSCQPNPCTVEFIAGVKSLECAEQLVGKSHVVARAVIADKVDCLAVLRFITEDDLCLFMLRGELPSIAQQVAEHDSQETFIAVRRKSFLDLDGHRASRISFSQFS